MLSGRAGYTPRVLRLIVAALLLFSCARVIRPLASWTASTSSEVAIHTPKVTRNIVLEVGACRANLVRPSVLRFRDTEVSLDPTPIALRISRQNHLVQIWPEQRRAFFRRILPVPFDVGH